MPLTNTSIKNAKPSARPVKRFDERGLFLIVTPGWWKMVVIEVASCCRRPKIDPVLEVVLIQN